MVHHSDGSCNNRFFGLPLWKPALRTDDGMDGPARHRTLELRLVALPQSPAMMAAALAPLLGMPTGGLLDRLAEGRVMPVADLDPETARRISVLAAVMDWPVQIGPPLQGGLRDLSAQLAVWADAERVSARLAPLLGMDQAAVATALARPGGLVLAGLDPSRAAATEGLLRRTRGLVVTASDPATARHDIYPSRPLSRAEAERLSACLGRIGAAGDALTGALASGLSRVLRDHILSRCPDLDLVAIDRRFQRFDLVLTGTCGWVTRDLADFLAARTQQPRARFEALSPAAPVTLDLGLRDTVARQFCGDYAAIGLFVRPVLSHRSGNP